MKKAMLAAGLAVSLALVMGGCGGSGSSSAAKASKPAESSGGSAVSQAPSGTSETPEASAPAESSEASAPEEGGAAQGEKLTFEYFATSMTVEWIQQIEAALKTLGEENNFELLSADANRDINTQLSQIDTAIEQKIDGAFLFIVDEGSAPAAVEKFNTAGIPVIGETLKLKDGDDKNIAPYVELDAVGVGGNCGKWVVENGEACGVDLSDLSKVGVIQNTNSKYQSDLARIDGFMEELKKGFPDLPDSNVFMADCAAEATSNDNTEASYNQVTAIISAHPEIASWIIMGSVDSYAMGACRAVEAAGVEEKTILVSAGGEMAIKEWANDSGACWRATCYYDAMDFAEKMVEGMLGICRDGKAAGDIYSDVKGDGEDFAAVKISGNMCTAENYQEFTS